MKISTSIKPKLPAMPTVSKTSFSSIKFPKVAGVKNPLKIPIKK